MSALGCRSADGGSGESSQTLRSEGERLAAGRGVHVHHSSVHPRRAGVQWTHCPHLRERHLQGTRLAVSAPSVAVVLVSHLFPSVASSFLQAFNRGKREGFFLKSVDNAPLAKRRKLKMTSTGVETRWSSSSSSSSSSTSSSASATASKAQPKQTVGPKPS